MNHSKSFIYRRKRKKAGKTVLSRYWYGRYQLPGDAKETDLPLQVVDKQVADAKLKRIVRELEQEREGMIAPRAIRERLQKPVVEQFEEYLAEFQSLGRNEKYLHGLRTQLSTLARECGWSTLKDITAVSFRSWRQRQTKAAKTLNEYFTASSAFLSWLERCERIPRNPLHSVERMCNHGDPCFRRRSLSEDEARRLLAVAGPRKPVYLTTLKIGPRPCRLTRNL